jgi:hypothetical protein
VRALRLRGRRGRIESPAHAYTEPELRRLVADTGLRVAHTETFRFHLMWPLDARPLVRLLNAIEERLPPHGVGDVLILVALKPR